jgi:hypothetical protein
MKKIKILLLLGFLFPISLCAQIKTYTEPVKEEPKPEPVWWEKYREQMLLPYDSTYLVVKTYPVMDAYQKYVGQRLYFPLQPEYSKETGDKYFDIIEVKYENYNVSDTIKNFDTLEDAVTKKMKETGNYSTKKLLIMAGNKRMYEEYYKYYHHYIEPEKYSPFFYLRDYGGGSGHNYKNESKPFESDKVPVFIVKDIQTNETKQINFDKIADYILVGGFIKLQQDYIGKIFITGNHILERYYIEDYPDHVKVFKWKGTDIELKPKFRTLTNPYNEEIKEIVYYYPEFEYILTLMNIDNPEETVKGDIASVNSKYYAENEYNKELAKINQTIKESKEWHAAQTELSAQDEAKARKTYTAKYGATAAKNIIKGEFVIGMSTAACKEVFEYHQNYSYEVTARSGNAKIGINERWRVYKPSTTQYLKFSGGKLIAITY